MKLYNNQPVQITSEAYGIPKGTHGVIVRQDYGDSDYRTYEVDFDCGKTLVEVAEYHLIGG
jgi:hypothetical protein